MFNWAPMKKMFLEELFYAVQKLETFDILEVLSQIVSEVVEVVVAGVKIGVKVK